MRSNHEVMLEIEDVAELADALRYIIETNEDPRKLRAFFSSFISAIWVEDDAARIEYHPEALVINQAPMMVPSTLKKLPGTGSLGTVVLVLDLPERLRKHRHGFGKVNA